jgi:pimeloyl-ACP methyl ester carboxylesterase
MRSFKPAAIAAATIVLLSITRGFAEPSEAQAMSFEVKSSTLKVPGAKIYYETRGSGPLVLMISGGPTDAGVFANLAQRIASRYTVVTYDPRGNSRSTFDAAPETPSADVHGDDAARLIEAVGGGPAYVFGNSGGAQIGLNLAARYPNRVRVLIAHEPPCLLMLEDPSKTLAQTQEVYDTNRSEGPGKAMHKFMTMNGMAKQEQQISTTPPGMAEMMARMQKNLDFFFAHVLLPLTRYRPDVDTLHANKTRVIVGVGAETSGQTANLTGVALAARLGVKPVIFPGDHNGYGPHAAEFAEMLRKEFSE